MITQSPTSTDLPWRSVFAAAESGGGRFLPLPLSLVRDERRAHDRVPVKLAAEIHHEGRQHAADTLDLSAGGLCMDTEAPLKVGSVVEVDIQLPTHEAPARVEAEVRWSRGRKTGLSFRAGAVAAVAAFVGSLLAAPTAMAAANTAVPQFDPNADIVLDMSAGGERPDERKVMEAFESQYGEFDQCVADAKHGRDRTLPGDVDVEILLNPKGHQPLGINAKLPSKVDKRTLRECLRGAVAAADYPSYNGPPVVVTFNFELDPGSDWVEE